MITTSNVITALKGARLIEGSITDKEVHDRFLCDFAGTFDDLMKDKKYLYFACEGSEWVHIYDNEEQLREMYSKQTHTAKDDDECYVELITQEITYAEFLERGNGTQMDFWRYSTLDGDLIFDFDFKEDM